MSQLDYNGLPFVYFVHSISTSADSFSEKSASILSFNIKVASIVYASKKSGTTLISNNVDDELVEEYELELLDTLLLVADRLLELEDVTELELEVPESELLLEDEVVIELLLELLLTLELDEVLELETLEEVVVLETEEELDDELPVILELDEVLV